MKVTLMYIFFHIFTTHVQALIVAPDFLVPCQKLQSPVYWPVFDTISEVLISLKMLDSQPDCQHSEKTASLPEIGSIMYQSHFGHYMDTDSCL